MRASNCKTAKKAVMTSLKQNFQNLKKVSSQIFIKTMWCKFQQNRFKNTEIEGPNRHTHILRRLTEIRHSNLGGRGRFFVNINTSITQMELF